MVDDAAPQVLVELQPVEEVEGMWVGEPVIDLLLSLANVAIHRSTQRVLH